MSHPGSPPTLKRFFDRVVRRSFGDHALCDDPAADYLSEHDRADARPQARLFRVLADRFEGYAGVLTYMRKVYFRPGHAPPDLPFFRQLVTAW